MKIKHKNDDKNVVITIFEEALKTIVWAFGAWRRLIEAMEKTLVNNVAATMPWAAPVPSAYMIWDHAVKILGWDVWVAWVLAVAVEGLGVSVASTAFDLWNWNDQNKDQEQKSSLRIAIGTVIFYLFIVIVVNVLLELKFPSWIAKAGISMLSITAVVTLALRSQHTRRVEQAAKNEEQKRVDDLNALKLQEKEKDAEFRRREREKDNEIKRALKLKALEGEQVGSVSSKVSVKVAETSENFGKFRDWRHVPEDERLRIFQHRNDVAWVMKEYGVIERTAYNWIENAEALYIKKLESNNQLSVTMEAQ